MSPHPDTPRHSPAAPPGPAQPAGAPFHEAPASVDRTDRGWRSIWQPRSAPPASRQPLLERVFDARGVPAPERDNFLRPTLRHLHDPSLIPDLDRAAERLLRATDAREPIVIYGDYDVDGITATAILYHVLRHCRPDADIRAYVPHRLEEGYGLNADALRALAEEGARVVVSVDCGITAVEPARVAREAGIDLIITDHHNPPATLDALPDAYAVVHPRRPDSNYPFGELPGAGVAYKLAWRLATLCAGNERVDEPTRVLLLEMLGLASLGVIADVVPLVGENRVIVRHGLGRVRQTTIPGLRALIEACDLDGEDLVAEDVGFKMGPRLNACGRLGHAREAVELLTSATGARARTIAAELSTLNTRRRAIAEKIEAEAIEAAEAAGMTGNDRRAIVLAGEGWHPGVVGIVCSRLAERFHRPAVLLCREDDGACRGSGRSVEGYSLHAGLSACADLLTTFGGHDMAAGLALLVEHLDAFTDRLCAHAGEHIAEEDLCARTRYDCDASLAELTMPGVAELERLGPFGRDNPRTTLRVLNAQLVGPAQTMGREARHLRLTLRQDDRAVRCVGWGMGDLADRLAHGTSVDAVLAPTLNTFQGQTRVQCELLDLRIARG